MTPVWGSPLIYFAVHPLFASPYRCVTCDLHNTQVLELLLAPFHKQEETQPQRHKEGTERLSRRMKIHTQICLTQKPMFSLTGQESARHKGSFDMPSLLSNLGKVPVDGGSLEDQTQSISGKASPSSQGPNQWC